MNDRTASTSSTKSTRRLRPSGVEESDLIRNDSSPVPREGVSTGPLVSGCGSAIVSREQSSAGGKWTRNVVPWPTAVS